MRSLERHGQLRCSGRWSLVTLSLESSLQTHCNKERTYTNQLQVCLALFPNSPEVSLQSGVNGEATSSWIHTGHILDIANFLECHFLSVIPVGVVKMLSQQSVWLYSAIGIHLRHVHVINEVDQLFSARRTILLPSLLFQRLFHHLDIKLSKLSHKKINYGMHDVSCNAPPPPPQVTGPIN